MVGTEKMFSGEGPHSRDVAGRDILEPNTLPTQNWQNMSMIPGISLEVDRSLNTRAHDELSPQMEGLACGLHSTPG